MEVYASVDRKRRWRKGRGFSNSELKKAGINRTQALKLGIQIDPKRSTLYDQNVENLKKYLRAHARVAVELTEIRGVGQKRYEKLRAVGVDSVERMANSNPLEIAEKVGVSEKTSARWIKAAKALLAK